jgi:SWI/SNF-related matrix-associated actin-dependent regulator 1 of chromatin subfamily A
MGLFGAEAATKNQALIVSYDSVQKWHPMIAEVEWDMLILDEVHLVKDETRRRAKSIFGGRYRDSGTFKPIRAKRKLFMTGTAIVNKPGDLWPLVKALAPDGLGASRVDFMSRYSAATQLDELHMRLKTQIMVRRLKADVLTELPAKRRQVILLDVPDSDNILAAEDRAIGLQKAALERAKSEIQGLPHAEQVMRLRQCRAIAMSEIAKVREETALKKLPQAIEHIHELLANVEKVVVFAHHHDVLDGLSAAFLRIMVGLDGRTELGKRQEAVNSFQHDRRVRLFLGGIRAAGLGLTLTAASVVCFVELDWTPAAMMQAEDRLHRIGQVNPVLVQHLVIDGSIDAKMARILIEKQSMIAAALDGEMPEELSRDVFTEVMRA